MYFSTGLPSMPLWFESWQPTNAGSTFGACLGLAGVAVLFRLLGAIRAQAERAWAQRAEGALRIEYEGIANGASTPGLKEDVKVLESAPLQPDGAGDRRVASSAGLAAAKKAARDAVRNGGIPFVWSQELSRALITTVWVGVGYFLMVSATAARIPFVGADSRLLLLSSRS